MQNLPPPPQPGRRSQYTDELLNKRLEYAHVVLNHTPRIISPATKHCFALYRDAIKEILNGDYVTGKGRRDDMIKKLIAMELAVFTGDLGHIQIMDISHTPMADRLREFRCFELAVRYGDYLADVFQKLNMAPIKELQVQHHYQKMPDGWDAWVTDTHAKLKDEEPDWQWYQGFNPSITKEMIKTTHAIREACWFLHLDRNYMLVFIELYAKALQQPRHQVTTGTSVHASADLKRLVDKDEYDTLLRRLQRDLRDAYKLIDDPAVIQVVTCTILAIAEQYFETKFKDEDDLVKLGLWNLNEPTRQHRDAKRLKSEKKRNQEQQQQPGPEKIEEDEEKEMMAKRAEYEKRCIVDRALARYQKLSKAARARESSDELWDKIGEAGVCPVVLVRRGV